MWDLVGNPEDRFSHYGCAVGASFSFVIQKIYVRAYLTYIMQTCPCNVDPLHPSFIYQNWGLQGYFCILQKNNHLFYVLINVLLAALAKQNPTPYIK